MICHYVSNILPLNSQFYKRKQILELFFPLYNWLETIIHIYNCKIPISDS